MFDAQLALEPVAISLVTFHTPFRAYTYEYSSEEGGPQSASLKTFVVMAILEIGYSRQVNGNALSERLNAVRGPSSSLKWSTYFTWTESNFSSETVRMAWFHIHQHLRGRSDDTLGGLCFVLKRKKVVQQNMMKK